MALSLTAQENNTSVASLPVEMAKIGKMQIDPRKTRFVLFYSDGVLTSGTVII